MNSSSDTQRVDSFSKKTHFAKGQVIFRQNSAADCAYIIETGEVEILIEAHGVETPLSYLSEGEIFGEMAIVDGKKRSATARALTDCTLTVVHQSQVQERVERADSIVRLLLMILIKRLRAHSQTNALPSITLEAPESLAWVQKDPKNVMEKIKFESELLQAVEKNNFLLLYQPIIDLKTEKMVGAEALIRWQHPQRGLVSPEVFMGIAEETSMIVPIGRWVINQACKDLKSLQQLLTASVQPIYVSINISGNQLQDPNIFQNLETAAATNQLRKSDLRIEITENILLSGAMAVNCLRKLKQSGFSVILDDFGTGYSSLSYLSELEFDFLKIDRSFTQKMSHDKKSKILCKSILNIAQELEIPVIAEGIEQQEQKQALTEFNCQYGQGFLFAKPLPLEQLIEFYKKTNKE